MRRRNFITLLGGAAAAWPLAGRAQQPAIGPRCWAPWMAAWVRDAPGLGVDLVLEEIAKHPSERNVHVPDDGKAFEPGTAAEDHHPPSPPRSSARGSSAFVQPRYDTCWSR